VEEEIKLGQCDDFKKDWTNIRPPKPKRGQISPTHYYLKPLAVFVPHLTVQNHTPHCPECKSPANVNVDKFKFVENAKPLFCLQEQRELHTVLYTCFGGGKEHSFVAHHQESLRLGGPKLLGIFRFYVAKTYAIDEHLHSFITSQPYAATSHLANLLATMVEKKYANDLIEYYSRAVRGETQTIQNGANVTHNDPSQLRVTNYTLRATTEASGLADIHNLATAVNRTKRAVLEFAGALARHKKMADDPIMLQPYVAEKSKKKHNNMPTIGSFGVSKTKDLMQAGFTTFLEFCEAWKRHEKGNSCAKLDNLFAIRRTKKKKSEDPAILVGQWAREVDKFLSERRQRYDSIKGKGAELEKARDEAVKAYTEATSAASTTTSTIEATSNADAEGMDIIAGSIIPFSGMLDKDGYHAKLLSADRIECILQTYFRDRREFMEASMLQLQGRVLSLDFFYPLASRIWVTKDDGSRQRFQPYKCIADIKNEDGLIIWFGALPHSESITALQDNLRLLRQRFVVLGANLHVVFYVDNCCTVRQKIKEAWPEAMVLLDAWHWLKRWRDILREPNSMDGRLFMALMSRAILVAEDGKVQEKQMELSARYGRPATLSEALRTLPTVVPPASDIEKNVWSVLNMFLQRDLVTETQNESRPEESTATKPVLVLKDRKHRSPIIRNQFRHVREGCLTDPNLQGDPNFADIVLYKTVGAKYYCCRGSSLNERYHLAVEQDVIGSRSTMGPAVAERLHWVKNTEWNKKANEKRNGAVKHYSRETEHLALANSLAEQANVESLPFADVSMPRKDPSAPVEKIGYGLGLGTASDEGSGLTIIDTVADSTDGDESQEATPGDIAVAPVLAQLTQEMAPILNHRRTEQRESTMEAFMRQSGGEPWVPFSRDLQTDNEVDREEHKVFDLLSQQYERNASPSSAKGYFQLAKAWEREVAQRIRSSVENGDDDIVLIRPKSVAQLQQHYDYLQEVSRIAAQPETDATVALERQRMNQTLRESRAAVNGLVTTTAARPVQYPTAVAALGHTVPLGLALMQPSIFGAALGLAIDSNIGNIAPFRIPNMPQATAVPTPQQQYDGRRRCVACGWLRSQHIKVGGTLLFGREKCTYDICGICNQSKSKHLQEARARNLAGDRIQSCMGKNCVFINNR